MSMSWLYLQVEVVSEDEPPAILATLIEGDIFGEISLVSSIPRRVTVRAKTHVDIFTLSKESLDEVLQHYPDMQEVIERQAFERFGAILEATGKK